MIGFLLENLINLHSSLYAYNNTARALTTRLFMKTMLSNI